MPVGMTDEGAGGVSSLAAASAERDRALRGPVTVAVRVLVGHGKNARWVSKEAISPSSEEMYLYIPMLVALLGGYLEGKHPRILLGHNVEPIVLELAPTRVWSDVMVLEERRHLWLPWCEVVSIPLFSFGVLPAGFADPVVAAAKDALVGIHNRVRGGPQLSIASIGASGSYRFSRKRFSH